MKMQCLSQNFKEAVAIADRNTSRNQSLPILNSILIDAQKNKIYLRATNLDSAIELYVPGKVLDSGSIVVPSKTLNMFISNTKDDQVVFQEQKNNLHVKTAKSESVIRGLQKEDFPIFPKIDSGYSVKLQSPEFRQAISSVVVAVSNSDIKPELNSVFFKIFKNTLKIAATDSFRLAEYILVSKNINSEQLLSFLVPQKSILEMARLMDKDEDVELGISKNQITLISDRFKFISRLTDGHFPDYEQIIPKNFKITALTKKNDLLANLKVAGVFVGKLNDITLKFDPVEKSVALETAHSEIGGHTSTIDSSIQGEAANMKFNLRYLSDGILQINHEYIVFSINGDSSPLLMKGKGDASYTYLLMPMRG